MRVVGDIVSLMASDHFSYLNREKNIVEHYSEDGELLGVAPVTPVDPVATLAERAVEVSLPTGDKVLVDPKNALPGGRWEYSLELASRLCERVVQGGFITRLCDGVNFPPYSVVARWKRTHHEFYTMLMEAYEDRAEFFGDKIRELADDADEENYSSQNVKIGAYKHLAALDSPKRFQTKQAVGPSSGAPVVVIVETGIRRKGDEGYTAVEVTRAGGMLESSSED